MQAEEQAHDVLGMWDSFLRNAKDDGPRKIACCLPRWHVLSGDITIAKKMLASAAKVGYTPLALFDNEFTCVYDRPGAYVARQIVILEKQ